MRFPPTERLIQFAVVGGVFVIGQAVLMKYLVFKRFHQSPYFTPAADMVLKHKGLVDYLGEPVKFGNPDLGDKTNYSCDTEANFEVPLKGSKVKGTMYFTSIRPLEADESVKRKWKVSKLEVIMDDRPNEKVVLVRPDDDNKA